MTALLSAKHEKRIARAVAREAARNKRRRDPKQMRRPPAESAARLRATLPPSYVAIIAESERVGWPMHFRVDLEYDLKAIRYHGVCKFVWVLRECGTHIMWGFQAQEILDILFRDGCGPHLYYAWTGTELIRVGYERARQYLGTLGRTEVVK